MSDNLNDIGPQLIGANSRDVGGHIWRCYRVGIERTEWRTDGGRWAVECSPETSIYWATVEGKRILSPLHGRDKRFRSLESAMRAAVKL